MCLGIPGRIVELVDPDRGIAKAEVGGVRRNVSIELLENEGTPVTVGDWILIHVGFALCKIDEEEAARESQREAERQRQAERPRPRQNLRQTERVEICIQPELDFSYAPDDRAHPQTALVPVANLAERRKAGLLDALFLGLTYIGFLGLFRSLGGQLLAEKGDAIVYLAAFFLFYALYFFLFTTFAEATPGMQLFCLTTVRLDGTVPDTRQLLWRSFGYVLAGATLMLGFLWALWDEDRFTWQDRISQTYITAAAPVVEPDALELPAGRHSFARK